mmetsp:Transcript_58423/g.162871  ORF Transcript_58423/g.162871 Transcript_58423/m.162871 type:complete len:246 (+) Transcript_58423:398-1135(+)
MASTARVALCTRSTRLGGALCATRKCWKPPKATLFRCDGWVRPRQRATRAHGHWRMGFTATVADPTRLPRSGGNPWGERSVGAAHSRRGSSRRGARSAIHARLLWRMLRKLVAIPTRSLSAGEGRFAGRNTPTTANLNASRRGRFPVQGRPSVRPRQRHWPMVSMATVVGRMKSRGGGVGHCAWKRLATIVGPSHHGNSMSVCAKASSLPQSVARAVRRIGPRARLPTSGAGRFRSRTDPGAVRS